MRGAPANRPRRTVSPEAGVRLLVEEACNKGNLGVLDTLLPAAIRSLGRDDQGMGMLSNLRGVLAEFRDAVPDARWTIEQQVTQGNTVVTRLKVRGTFHGSMVGLASPGRQATVAGVVFTRFADGRIADLWVQADLLGLLRQLGVMPELDLARAVTVARVMQAGALMSGEEVAVSP